MADMTTLDPMYWPLMELPSVRIPCCAVCGRNRPIEQHHFVWRSWGEMDRAEFGKLLDGVVQECHQQGIETRTPEEIARMKWIEGEG